MKQYPFGATTGASEVAQTFHDEIVGKTILVTGISPQGLGAEFVRTIAPHNPGLVIMASRTPSGMETVSEELRKINPKITIRTLTVDMGSLAAVRQAAAQILAYEEKIDIVVNNAVVNGIPYTLTAEGYELTFVVGYLGHFLLTNLIRPKLSANARILNITSLQHHMSDIDYEDPWFNNGQTYDREIAYSRSKTAAILFSKALANRGLISFSIHPGIAQTTIQRHYSKQEVQSAIDAFGLTWQTFQQAVAGYVLAAFQPDLVEVNGAYIASCQVGKPASYAEDPENVEKLWKFSEKLVGQEF